MKTSSFSISGTDPNAVSIARMQPRWFHFTGRKYPTLAPSRPLLKAWNAQEIDEQEYTEMFYRETLAKVTPEQVLEDLGEDAILLCYEPPGKFCHRRIVARWLEEGLGIQVPEVEDK